MPLMDVTPFMTARGALGLFESGMPSHSVNAATKREWRELSFYYDRDDEARVWRLTAS
jgi:hypothetical protein